MGIGRVARKAKASLSGPELPLRQKQMWTPAGSSAYKMSSLIPTVGLLIR